jgi:hypothetical protein
MSALLSQDMIGGLLFLLLSRTAEFSNLFFFVLLLDPLKRIILVQVYLRAVGETVEEIPLEPGPAVEAVP